MEAQLQDPQWTRLSEWRNKAIATLTGDAREKTLSGLDDISRTADSYGWEDPELIHGEGAGGKPVLLIRDANYKRK